MAYAPEYNPIERVWAQLKAQFKKEKMGLILEGRSPNYEKIIRRILQAYPAEKDLQHLRGDHEKPDGSMI